jgi:N-methylhydantoinase A
VASRRALTIHKAATTPHDPVVGVLTVWPCAAEAPRAAQRYLARGEMLLHGTTHAINAM